MEMKLRIFKYPPGAFDEENVIRFISASLSALEKELETLDRETYRDRLNIMADATFSRTYSVKTNAVLHLKFSVSLAYYAQQFGNIETCNNVLKNLSEPNVKDVASSRFPYEYRYAMALCYYVRFNSNLSEANENYLGKEDLSDLIDAKYYLLKIYSEHKSKRLELSESKLAEAVTLLASVLSQLSRWPEVLNILDTEFKVASKSTEFMASYLRARTLEDIMNKTCLNHNGLLLYAILGHCENVLSFKGGVIAMIKSSVDQVRGNIVSLLKKHNLNTDELEEHAKKEYFKIQEKPDFTKFLHGNRLFLNEHQFFCKCDSILGDDLEIETSHKHTKIEWIDDKKRIFEDIKAEFSLARIELYKSVAPQSLAGLHSNTFSRSKKSRHHIKMSMLKSSFRRCYSILDKICSSILLALDVDIDAIRDESGNKINIYFLNVWDFDLITDDDFKRNQSLHALYSIARDLDRSKKSALRGFKDVRNSIEHRFLQVVEAKSDIKNNIISEKEMREYSELLLKITRSAIFAYTYFLRQESKSRAKSIGLSLKSSNE